MPIYPMICQSGHRWEQFYKLADKPTACPTCGAPCESDFAALNVSGCVKGARGFEDRKQSVVHFHAPDDVQRMRDEYGPIGAKCIRDDGSVQFASAKDEAEYRKAKKNFDRRTRERGIDKEMAERDLIKKGNMVEVSEPLFGTPHEKAAELPKELAKKRRRNPGVIRSGRTKGRVAT